MSNLRKSTLSNFWQDKLNRCMESSFPKTLETYLLIDSYMESFHKDSNKEDVRLSGVYQDPQSNKYYLCIFQGNKSYYKQVVPRFEHTGWKGVI